MTQALKQRHASGGGERLAELAHHLADVGTAGDAAKAVVCARRAQGPTV